MGIKSAQLHETKALTSSQQATLQVPVYGTIQSLVLRFATNAGAAATEAQIRAEIGNIRLTFNGRDIVNTTAARLFDLYESLGQRVDLATGVAGNVELNLGRLLFQLGEVRDNFGFGTADLTTIQVSVTALTLSSVASVQAISFRDSANKTLGAHCKFIDYPQSFNATGQHTTDTLPRDPDSAYLLVSTSTGASGVVTNGEVRVNNVTIMENLPRDTNTLAQSNNGITQQAALGFLYCFNDGTQGAILPMSGITDFRLITTFSTAPGAAGYVHSALTVNGLTITGK